MPKTPTKHTQIDELLRTLEECDRGLELIASTQNKIGAEKKLVSQVRRDSYNRLRQLISPEDLETIELEIAYLLGTTYFKIYKLLEETKDKYKTKKQKTIEELRNLEYDFPNR